MEKTKKELPVLRKQSSTFKMVIPKEVEEKIRHLCRCCPTVEWSGKLFYRTEGSVANKDLVITCVDIYVMDIGTSGYTEFDETPDFFGYMVDKDLMDCNIGLIHSHNTMNTFFSGTDTDTLRSEGNDHNHFVSLIVNNAGKYTAAVTTKVFSKYKIEETKYYRTFDDSEVDIEGKDNWEETGETIEYYMLDIDKAEVPSVFNELDERLNEIRAAKKWKASNERTIPTWDSRPQSFMQDKWDFPVKNDYTFKGDNYKIFEHFPKEEAIQPSLFRDDEIEEPDKFQVYEIADRISLQLITGSIAITDNSRIKIEDFVKNMEPLFDKRFGGDDAGLGKYAYWIDTYIDFLLEDELPEGLEVEEENILYNNVYENLLLNLDMLPTNKYIDIIKECIESRFV